MRNILLHLWHFGIRVIDYAISLGGTSRVGFFGLLLLPPVLAGLNSLRKQHAAGSDWWSAVKLFRPSSLFRIPVFVIWVCLLIWSIGAVTYEDHIALLATKQAAEIDAQRWKSASEHPQVSPSKPATPELDRPRVYPTISLVDSPSVTLDTKRSPVTNARLTLIHTTAVRSLNIVGLAPGAYVTVSLRQDYTGGAAITLGIGCTWYVQTGAGYTQGATPRLTTAANSVNILAIWYDGANCYANLG
jgi:hypothetical protein